MVFYLFFLMVVLVGGMIVIVFNLVFYFVVFGLVVVVGVGCGILVSYGGLFLFLIFFLIYLGGMFVVFVYLVVLVVEFFFEVWGDCVVFWCVMVYGLVVIVVVGFLLIGDIGLLILVDVFKEFFVIWVDVSGVVIIYLLGGKILVICVWVLFLILFVVLEVIWGFSYGVFCVI